MILYIIIILLVIVLILQFNDKGTEKFSDGFIHPVYSNKPTNYYHRSDIPPLPKPTICKSFENAGSPFLNPSDYNMNIQTMCGTELPVGFAEGRTMSGPRTPQWLGGIQIYK